MGEVVVQLLEICPASLDSAVEVTEVVTVSGFFHEGWDYCSKVILTVGELG